jgi:hypothetical protein
MRSNNLLLTLVASLMVALPFVPSNTVAFRFGGGGGQRQQRQQVVPAHEPEVDLYADLGLDEDATEKEIKKAYRKLSLKYHPDHSKGDAEAAGKFMKISDAYGVLGNEEKKFLYDMGGMEAVAQAGSGGQDQQMGGFFGGLFGGGGRQRGNRGM